MSPATTHRAEPVWRLGRTAAAWLACTLVLLQGCGGGGGGASTTEAARVPALGAADLAVLYAEGDATSTAIAREYQRVRGIPEANMIAVAVPAGSAGITAEAFTQMKAAIDARLPSTAQATLITWTQPSRVLGACTMSLTSALAFGYDARWCGGCVATRASPYFDSASTRPWSELGVRPSMMLGAATLAEAQALIARGAAADGSLADGSTTAHAWLMRTSDAARSVRYNDFRSLASGTLAGVTLHYVDNSAGGASDVVADQSGVMFYFTGLASVPQAASNRWLPGAIADHLTSFGGVLPGGNGQMPATDWLRAGATASYGTVTEPCNYTEKFPRASIATVRYRRGESLIEAYWKSVQWPGEGLFVGEPLARPWAR